MNLDVTGKSLQRRLSYESKRSFSRGFGGMALHRCITLAGKWPFIMEVKRVDAKA